MVWAGTLEGVAGDLIFRFPEPDLPIHYFLSRSFLSPVENWPRNFNFLGKWGGSFRDPRKAHPCAKRHHLAYWP